MCAGHGGEGGRRASLVEVLAVTGAATAAAATIARAGGAPWRLQWMLIPCVWALAGLAPTALRGTPWERIGFSLKRPRQALRTFAVLTLVVFPALLCGVLLLKAFGLAPLLRPAPPRAGWALWALYQFLYVAVSEEVFFRGYAQSSLTRWARSALGGRASRADRAGIALSAALFALAHVAVCGSAAAASVFFPGLIFGWLRARTDSLLAPVLFHGLSNVGYAAICLVVYGGV